MKFTLYDNNGNVVKSACNDAELAELVNWVYEHNEGFIMNEKGDIVEV